MPLGGPAPRWPRRWDWPTGSAELLRQAEGLRERFEEAFWCDELSTYALALDGDKRPCRVQVLQRRPVPVRRHRLIPRGGGSARRS